MIKVTNNMGHTILLNDKELEIVSIIYSVGKYTLKDGDYKVSEDMITKRGLALWNIFGRTLHPIPNLMILPEILSQWDDTTKGNIILKNLFGDYENNNRK